MYKLGRLLGKGSFGEVYELLQNKNKTEKVIKFIKLNYYGIENYLECYILLHLSNPHILYSHQITLENNTIKMVFDIANGNLFDYLKKKIYLNKYSLAKQLSRGLNYLHSYNILHGDIKPENILCFDNRGDKIWKYADFGMSRLCKHRYINELIYTYIYRPPEIYNFIVDLRSDIWALGCTFYEIWCREKYFTSTGNNNQSFFHINKLDKNEKIYSVICNMMRKDFSFRITSEELCKSLDVIIIPKKDFSFDIGKISKYYNLEGGDISILKKKLYGHIKKKKISNKWLKIEKDICNVKKFNFNYFT